MYPRDVWKGRCQGLLARPCFDSCTKYFVSVSKYLKEQRKEEDVAILAPGCKGPSQVLGRSITEAGVCGRGLRLIYTSRWMKSRKRSCQPFRLLSAFLFCSVSVLSPQDQDSYYLDDPPPTQLIFAENFHGVCLTSLPGDS